MFLENFLLYLLEQELLGRRQRRFNRRKDDAPAYQEPGAAPPGNVSGSDATGRVHPCLAHRRDCVVDRRPVDGLRAGLLLLRLFRPKPASVTESRRRVT